MTIDLNQFWKSEFLEHTATMIATSQNLEKEFIKLIEQSTRAVQDGKKVLFFGNGGSASDSQHLATELTCRYKKDRAAIPAIALTTDTSALTACGNDFGYESVFARQVEALGIKGDICIGISTSGTSKNVVKGLEVAKEKGLITVGFTGETGGVMNDLCDIIFRVPSKTTARIQEMHITIGQMFCGALEQNLGLVEPELPEVDTNVLSDLLLKVA